MLCYIILHQRKNNFNNKEGIITILEGTYSSGAASVHCWVFTEPNEAEKESYVPHNEEDVISIKDGYWYINNTKTICKR